MKSFRIVLPALLVFLLALPLHSQNKLPSVSLKTRTGRICDIRQCLEEGVPVIISFWSLGCKPCIQELDNINENYADWMEEADFKMYIVSVDDARNSSKAASFAQGKGWSDFVLLLDDNQELKRAMNVEYVPTSFVVNPNGEIVYRHIGYTPGNEEELLEIVKEYQKSASK